MKTTSIHHNLIPSLSIVIPTFNRKDIVSKALQNLANEQSKSHFEVIVVIDGSTDGTFQHLEQLKLPYPIKLIFHQNKGLAATRNVGADAASADVILFIDDDMLARKGLVDAHVLAHQASIDVAVGRLGFDPTSPDTILAKFVRQWTDIFHQQLLQEGISTGMQVQGGHLSVKKACFQNNGGFAERYNEGGRYGNEDMDFGLRLFEQNAIVVYEPAAITDQYYAVTAKIRFKQIRELASADVEFAKTMPDMVERLNHHKLTYGIIPFLPIDLFSRFMPKLCFTLLFPLRSLVCKKIDNLEKTELTYKLFSVVQGSAYRAGLSDSGEPWP